MGFLGEMPTEVVLREAGHTTAELPPCGPSLRGVPSNGAHVSPHLGLQDSLEPAARDLPEKNRRGFHETAALWWLLWSLHRARETE